MALPTVQDLKDYLRIEFNTENALCAALLARATAMLELWMDVPITARSRTAVDRASGENAATALVFPCRPIGAVSVVDDEGTTVPATDYVVDAEAGMVWGKGGYVFVRGPYTITASCGLSLRSDYVQDLERYAGLLQHGLRARYQMFLMGTEDAHLAIEGPAAAYFNTCRRVARLLSRFAPPRP